MTDMEFIKGFDLSTLTQQERCGAVYYDEAGKPADAMKLLAGYGGNYVRLRLWNDPYSPEGESYGAGVCDLPSVLQLAHRAKLNGMQWLLDLHYSDFWADPGKQFCPKAWAGLDEDQLEEAVYRYTYDVLCACRAANVVPEMVQVGNELTSGLLWPHGKLPNYEGMVRYLKAGVRAVRDFDPGILLMMHLDNGSNNGLYTSWFDRYFELGGECDIIGLSYYPLWHGTIEGLRENMQDLARRYGKPMVLSELSAHHTLEDYARYENREPCQRKGAPLKEELVKKLKYPATPQGQLDFLEEICGILRELPGELGRGFFWWEAAWIPVPGCGWAERAGWEYVREEGPGGNEWANQTLFDFEGHPLPALKAFPKL